MARFQRRRDPFRTVLYYPIRLPMWLQWIGWSVMMTSCLLFVAISVYASPGFMIPIYVVSGAGWVFLFRWRGRRPMRRPPPPPEADGAGNPVRPPAPVPLLVGAAEKELPRAA